MAGKRIKKGPWRRGERDGNPYGPWLTTVGRQTVKLAEADATEAEAELAYNALMASGQKPTTVRVSRLVDEFLNYVKLHRAPATFVWYENYLRSFVAFVGPKSRVSSLTPAMVNRWIEQRYADASPSCRHNAARSVVRMLNWAVAERIIRQSPLIGFIKPAPSRRESIVTPRQYAQCVKCAKGWVRDAVKFFWHTGCRPFELRHLESRFVEGNKVVFPASLSKGKKKRRVIYLDSIAAAIVARLSAQYPDGPIFRNRNGQPLGKRSFNDAFERLRSRVDIEGLCAYSFRHAWITRMLERGVDVATVAALAGNSPQVVLEQYNHVANNPARLASVVSQLGAPLDTAQAGPA